MPLRGRKQGLLAASELGRLRETFGGIACELEKGDRLAKFDVGGETKLGKRALYIQRAWPHGGVTSGLQTIPLDVAQLGKVNELLGWPKQSALRRDRAVAVGDRTFFYSIHKLYDRKTRLLTEQAIVLHDKGGRILAHELERGIDKEPPCADCENPKYEDADFGPGLLIPLNLFELAGFPYPLVLLDTGTVEGRALSLFTFAPDGKASELRVYEYVMNCAPAEN